MAMKRVMIVMISIMISSVLAAQELPDKKLSYKGDVLASCYALVQNNSQGYALAFETTHGLLFNRKIFWGLGTGILWSLTNSEASVPFYTEARYYFNNATCRPFFAVKTGGVFCIDRTDNAFIASPILGISFKSLQFKLGYQYNAGISSLRDNISGENVTVKYNLNSLYLSIGYAF